ncbi:MAG TPA: hypothetical protein VHZ03_55710 [Trebonia sp.]|nr:hypothetical protein [Trebonia sp.]
MTAAHGATVRLAAGATLVIPPGALSGNGRLIARTGGQQAATSLSLAGQPGAAAPVVAFAGSQVQFELDGATLVRPADLTMNLDPGSVARAAAAAGKPGAAWLAFYDSVAHRWQPVASRYDATTHSLSAEVTHLSLWAPFTFAWQQIGTALREALTSLLSERAAPVPCPGVTGVTVVSSGGPGGPVQGCASQAGTDIVTVTVTNNRGYAMVVPTPSGVAPGPRQYTDYTEFLRTQPGAQQKLGGEYLAPESSLTYTMPLHGPPITFDAAASVKTYTLDAGIILTKEIMNVRSAGLSDCILDNMASSGPLPLSAAPGLLAECIPILGGPAKDALEGLGDFVAAIAFARQYVGGVLDLNGDARSGFTGTVQVTRLAMPLPDFYFSTLFEKQTIYADPAFPGTLGIDNVDWIAIQDVNEWGPDSMTMTGVLHYDECKPSCAGGPQVTFPVQVVASLPRTCSVNVGWVGSTSPEEAYVYSTISVNALAGSPPSFLTGSSVFQVCAK